MAKLTIVALDGTVLKAPSQAPPMPPDTIIALGRIVVTGHTLPIRIFAGVAFLCCHGVKRWSDVQHLRKFEVNPDSIVVTS